MGHWAQVENGRVVSVVVAGDDRQQWLADNLGGTWIQTSYNTYGGVHFTDGEPSADQSKALRFNYAGIGYAYDWDRDAFIPPKPYPSWVLDEETCLWVAPVSKPDGDFEWDEVQGDWVEVV